MTLSGIGRSFSSKESTLRRGVTMGFVYAFQYGDTDRFKIGKSANPSGRRKQLETANPDGMTEVFRVETTDPTKCERYVHQRLDAFRLHGKPEIFVGLPVEEVVLALKKGREWVDEYVPRWSEAERLKTLESTGVLLAPTDEHVLTYERLRDVAAQIKRLEIEKEELETDLKLAIGTAGGLAGLVTWKSSEVSHFDSSRFREAHPELYESFSYKRIQRRFLSL
jgi:hypothetical protein